MQVSTSGNISCSTALIFDLDGTLVDSEWRNFLAFRRACLIANLPVPSCFYLTRVGYGLPFLLQELEINFGYSKQKCQQFARAYAAQKRAVSADHPRPQPGAHRILLSCRKLGKPVALATSANRPTALKRLAAAGLESYFDVVLTRDEAGTRKPDSRVYAMAAEALGVSPNYCLALEDSGAGIRSALGAGMPVVAVKDCAIIEPDLVTRCRSGQIPLVEIAELFSEMMADERAA